MLGPRTLRYGVTLQAIVGAMAANQTDESPLRVADMGAGYGLALRQLHWYLPSAQRVETYAVDLFERRVRGLARWMRSIVTEETPGALDDAYQPQFIRQDVTNVQLPVPADLIVSEQVVQYLDNPLGALANWYNQLAPNGAMIVSSDHMWPQALAVSEQQGLNNPVESMLAKLRSRGDAIATADKHALTRPRKFGMSGCFTALAIRRRSPVRLALNAEVSSVAADENGFKTIKYRMQAPDRPLWDYGVGGTR